MLNQLLNGTQCSLTCPTPSLLHSRECICCWGLGLTHGLHLGGITVCILRHFFLHFTQNFLQLLHLFQLSFAVILHQEAHLPSCFRLPGHCSLPSLGQHCSSSAGSVMPRALLSWSLSMTRNQLSPQDVECSIMLLLQEMHGCKCHRCCVYMTGPLYGIQPSGKGKTRCCGLLTESSLPLLLSSIWALREACCFSRSASTCSFCLALVLSCNRQKSSASYLASYTCFPRGIGLRMPA